MNSPYSHLTSMDFAERADHQRNCGNFKQALALAEASLSIKDDTSDEGWAIALRCLGTLEWGRGNVAGARNRYESALNLRRSQNPPSSQGLVAALDDLGVACYFSDMNAKALLLRNEALAIAESWPPPRTALHRRLRRRLAQSLQKNGAVDIAEELYLACRPLDEDGLDDKLGWYNAMALLAESKGEIAEAAEWFEILIDVLEGEEKSAGLAQALGNAVLARLELGNVGDTTILLRKLRKLCRTDSKLSARLALLDVRMELLRSRRRYAPALKVALRGEQAVRTALGGDTPDPIRLVLCALLLRANGKHEEARELLERLAPDQDASGVFAVPLLTELASLRLCAGEPDSALGLLRLALVADAGQPDPAHKWGIFSTVADVAHRLGRPQASALLGKMALAQLHGPARGLSGTQFDSWLQPRMAAYDQLLNRLTATGRVREATTLQLRRSQEMARAMGSCRASFDGTVSDVPLRRGEKRLWDRYSELQRAMKDKIEAGDLAPLSQAEIDRIHAWLDDVLEERFDTEADLRQPGAIRRARGAHPLLSFLPKGDGLLGVLSMPDGDFEFLVAANAETVAADIRSLWDSLRTNRGDWQRPSRGLYDALIAPARGRLAGAPRLDVVASGMMAFVPFAALHDGSAFLVESMALAFRTGQDLPARTRSLTSRWNSVSFASVKHSDLRRAGPEARLVEQKTRGKAFIDEEFTAGSLQAMLDEGVSLLHIATHFDLVAGRPHESALLLGDGTSLALSQIAGARYDFSGVELVTLSACETGISDTLDLGLEGFAGLLQAKGARHVVATVWRVDDEAAEALMSRFYEDFDPDAAFDPVAALARAQKAMLRGDANRGGAFHTGHGIGAASPLSQARLASPAGWAGFVVFDR